MKKLNLTEKYGFSQIFVLVGMLLVAVSLPIATRLVQQNQENRSSAASNATYQKCTISTAKCENGQMYFCADGTKWNTADKCKSGKCNSSGTACQAQVGTATCTENATKCTGSRMYKCDGGSWVGQSTCPSGNCNSAGTACAAPGPTTVGCSSSTCYKCTGSTECGNVGCLWGYNGSSAMRCYSKGEAIPTTTSACIPVTGVSISGVTLKPGESKVITANITPSNASCYTISWGGGGNGITVSGNGKSATVKAASGLTKEVSVQVTVTVKNKETSDASNKILKNFVSEIKRTFIKEVNAAGSVSGSATVNVVVCSPGNCELCEADKCSSTSGCTWYGGTLGYCKLKATMPNGSKCNDNTNCISGHCNAEKFCVPSDGYCYSTAIGAVVSNGATVCKDKILYTCKNGSFDSGVSSDCGTGSDTCLASELFEYKCENNILLKCDIVGVGNYWKTADNGDCAAAGKVCSNNKCIDSMEAALGVCGTAHNTVSTTKPTSNLCKTTYGNSTPVAAGGAISWRWTCTGSNGGAAANCYTVASASTTIYYYYNSSAKMCSSTSAYTSLNDCLAGEKKACFSSLSSCNSAYSCQSLGGMCRATCGADETITGNGSGECSPAKCCVLNTNATKKDGVCGSTGGSAYHPSDSAACKVGNVYWTDISGTDGTDGFNWRCDGVAGGAPATCSSKKINQDSKCTAIGGVCKSYSDCSKEGKTYVTGYCTTGESAGADYACCGGTGTNKPGGGGNPGGGGDDGGSVPTPCTNTVKITPSTLTLKVGATSTLVATNSCSGTSTGMTWSIDNANIATVSADGVVTGVAVGSTATVTATNTNGTKATASVIVISSEANTLSFKIAFSGIKATYVNSKGENYNCLGSLGDMFIEVVNKPKNISEKFENVKVSVVGNEVNNNQNQVFQISNLSVGSSLQAVDNYNYVKVKGPFHLKRRMCSDGQNGKLDETTVCDIDLTRNDGHVYDFSEYELLAGDVDSNGSVNGVDWVTVKNAVDAGAEPVCGIANDLNMDGMVNGIDLALIRDISLAQVDDE